MSQHKNIQQTDFIKTKASNCAFPSHQASPFHDDRLPLHPPPRAFTCWDWDLRSATAELRSLRGLVERLRQPRSWRQDYPSVKKFDIYKWAKISYISETLHVWNMYVGSRPRQLKYEGVMSQTWLAHAKVSSHARHDPLAHAGMLLPWGTFLLQLLQSGGSRYVKSQLAFGYSNNQGQGSGTSAWLTRRHRLAQGCEICLAVLHILSSSLDPG